MNYSLKALYVDLRSSRTLAVLLGASGLGACALLIFLPMSPWLAGLIIVVVVLAVAHALALHALLMLPAAVMNIEITAQGEMYCTLRSGARVVVTVLGNSTVMPWLTVLNLRQAERRLARHVVLLPDSMAADEFRRLRVWLRWGSQALPKDA